MPVLLNRNVYVGERRTSMRLEPEMWSALEEICLRENVTLAQLTERIAGTMEDEGSHTSAVRTFALNYFRNAATEEGHEAAHHGKIEKVLA